MKYCFVSCTKSNEKDFYENTPLGQSFKKLDIKDTYVRYENTEGMSFCYNEGIENIKDRYDIAIFIHDDVYILDAFWKEKLDISLETYDIVGVVGTAEFIMKLGLNRPPNIISWHACSPDKSKSGGCFHTIQDKGRSLSDIYYTPFGPFNIRCATLDGLFIAARLDKLGQVRFDEDFKWHFYDLSFCVNANRNNLKLGTCPIAVAHMSHGAGVYDEIYKQNQTKFIEKYCTKKE